MGAKISVAFFLFGVSGRIPFDLSGFSSLEKDEGP